MRVIKADHLISSYDEKHPPCAEVELGEAFIIETHDRIPVMAKAETLPGSFQDRFNPIYAVTGPVFIKQAYPGNVLEVEIIDVTLTHDKGVIVATPGRAGFGDKIQEPQSRIVEIKGEEIHFTEKIRVPVGAHIGKLATTPLGKAVPTGSPGSHGGNMDNKHLTTGSRIFLPVFVEGALLSLGDLHAAMGDGESNSSGVEATGQVTLRCNVQQGLDVKQPLVVTPEEVQMLGQGETLEEACRLALDHMANLICGELHIDYNHAAMLISIAGDLHICQIANPLVGVRVSLSKAYFGESHWL
jgi:amidase